MKKLLVIFLLAIVAGTTIAATVTHLVSKNETLGRRSVTFEQDGVEYVITDKATIDAIEKVTRRQTELGLAQARLGADQARLGAQQMNGATDEQRRALEAAQHELAEKQAELADQQQVEGEKAEKELEKIFRNAVKTGIARKR